MYILIHGSAVNPDAKEVRDIDVQYEGNINAVVKRVKEWIKEKGLDHLPIDMHMRYSLAGKTELPVPIGMPMYYELIEGNVDVKKEEWRNLPALLRLSEVNEDKARELILDEKNSILIGLTEGAGNAYEGDGPVSLSNALRHSSEEFLSSLGDLGELLKKIKKLGDKWPKFISQEAREFAEKNSSGGFGRYEYRVISSVMRTGVWQLQYDEDVNGNLRTLTSEELWKTIVKIPQYEKWGRFDCYSPDFI